MKIVILSGTGLIGSKVVNLLRARGHEVVAASPSRDINSITGEGSTEALTGAHVVPGQLAPLAMGPLAPSSG
jgi:nucleoside-diphosphate-sugar epimerase